MHELAICQALIDEVEAIARRQQASSVTDVYISVGPLSGAESPLLQSAFPIAAAGTVAASAELHLATAPVRVACGECGRESDVTMNRLVCKYCGDWRTQLLGGDELLLQRVILADARPGEAKHV